MTGGLDLGANTFDTTGNATLGTISGDYLVAPSGTLSFGSSDLITTGDLTCKGVFTAGPGGAGDTVINWKTGNTIRYVMGVDDSEDDMFILAGATGFQNDNLISVDTLGAMWVAERIKFVQEDGAEQITSDTDGDLDIIAGTGTDFQINNLQEMRITANRMTFENGATDTNFGWTTTGVLDHLIGGSTEMSLAANTLTLNAGASDPTLDWSTNGELFISANTILISAFTTRIGSQGDDDYVEIGVTGDTIFVGEAGHVYGSMYQHETTQTVDLVQNVYVVIPGWTTGNMDNVSVLGATTMNALVAGMYKIDWSVSGTMATGANETLEIDIFKNAVEQEDGSARRKIAAAGDQGNAGATAIISANALDTFDLRIKNVTSSNDFVVTHCNFNILQVGG